MEITMAMTMTGECPISASRNIIWRMLNDPEVLRACIPGCEELNKTSETSFEAVATSKIGPVKARFKGRVELSDLDEPNGYCLTGEGNGGIAGFAKGRAKVKLLTVARTPFSLTKSKHRSAGSSHSLASG
jgi:carbon monoxide dehydrogenase subunit G